MGFQLLLLSLLLICSAFFSGAETALFALTRHEIHRFRKSSRASRRLVATLLRHPRKLLLTLMIGNVTINMFIFAASLGLFESIEGVGPVMAACLGLMSPIAVTLFGEILPKGTAIVLRTYLAPRLAPTVEFFQLVIAPLRFAMNVLLVEPLTRLLVGGKKPSQDLSTEELRQLVEMSQRRRIIDADENVMLSQVILLGELRVRDVMVPRVDIIAFEINDDPGRLVQLLRERRFTRLPVYEHDIDRIVGLVYAKDLLLHPGQPLRRMIRPAHFVPELITLAQALAELRRTGTQSAVVVDEHGGVVGLVTMEDVAGRIVGELAPAENEGETGTWERLDERRYRIAGGVNIHEWTQMFHKHELEEEVTTLAGLVLARLGRIPEKGDSVRLGNLRLTVESLRGRRIEWILVELCAPALPEQSTRGTAT